jgi:hypothetical protein
MHKRPPPETDEERKERVSRINRDIGEHIAESAIERQEWQRRRAENR